MKPSGALTQTYPADAGTHVGSLAVSQKGIGTDHSFPLWPPLPFGSPIGEPDGVETAVEVDFDYARVPHSLFLEPVCAGLDRWAPLLPPLVPKISLGEGATPLIEAPELRAWANIPGRVMIKDESRNPTWSHKDRLNRIAVGTGLQVGAQGIAVASTGNHGISAAAYAAKAGLPCIVLSLDSISSAAATMLSAFGAKAVVAPLDQRWSFIKRLVDEKGFHSVSNMTTYHTGHPFGPEGYKTIAYEIFLDLGRRVPSCVVVPTGYGELLYGIQKGFQELRILGLTSRIPRMVSVEPASCGPIARALAEGRRAVRIALGETAAVAIATPVGGVRGTAALRNSDGIALLVDDTAAFEAQEIAAKAGHFMEVSSAAAVAGLRILAQEYIDTIDDIVVVQTSTGLKGEPTSNSKPVKIANWADLQTVLGLT